MADLFQLDPTTLATVENGIDSLIHQLGKQCKLEYEAGADSETQCPNCNYDPNTNRSSNIYNGVGPKPFQGGKCPVCKGKGYMPRSGVRYDIVQLLIDWQPKPWNFFDPNTNLRLPQGMVSTKGFVADMPKIIQAKSIIIDYQNSSLTTNRFIRWQEPVLQGNIVKSKYFVCFWQRFGS